MCYSNQHHTLPSQLHQKWKAKPSQLHLIAPTVYFRLHQWHRGPRYLALTTATTFRKIVVSVSSPVARGLRPSLRLNIARSSSQLKVAGSGAGPKCSAAAPATAPVTLQSHCLTEWQWPRTHLLHSRVQQRGSLRVRWLSVRGACIRAAT